MTKLSARLAALCALSLALLVAACTTIPKAGTIVLGDRLENVEPAPDANAADDQWAGAKPTHGEPPPGLAVAPPRGSFGYEGCGRFAIWVFLADGKSYRIDSEHAPKTAQDMRKLLDWLNQGPTDIIKYEAKDCGTGA